MARPPRLSVIVPAHDCAAYLHSCLEHVRASSLAPDAWELIVVDDGSPDGATAAVAEELGATVVRRNVRGGPGAARNDGARAARGELLFFLDADVCVRPDTLEKAVAAVEAEGGSDALFGSYDDAPAAPSFVSQYRNLLHHFVHQQGNERATTFWAGAGAIRREALVEAGGFYEGYGRPCIEDIELGARLVRLGRTIRLDRQLLVKHLKRWSLTGMVRADVRDRALPWTELILRAREMPNDLNLRLSQRVSALLAAVAAVALLAGALHDPVLLLLPPLALAAVAIADAGSARGLRASIALGALLLVAGTALLAAATRAPAFAISLGALGAMLLTNHRLYAFFAGRRGIAFAVLVVPLQLVYYLGSSAAFLIGVLIHLWRGRPSLEPVVNLR